VLAYQSSTSLRVVDVIMNREVYAQLHSNVSGAEPRLFLPRESVVCSANKQPVRSGHYHAALLKGNWAREIHCSTAVARNAANVYDNCLWKGGYWITQSVSRNQGVMSRAAARTLVSPSRGSNFYSSGQVVAFHPTLGEAPPGCICTSSVRALGRRSQTDVRLPRRIVMRLCNRNCPADRSPPRVLKVTDKTCQVRCGILFGSLRFSLPAEVYRRTEPRRNVQPVYQRKGRL
jgi:hypothetical protein